MDTFSFTGNNLNPEAQLEEIASLLRAGQKIQAIKLYREITGASLSTARSAVERLEQAMLSGALTTTGLSEKPPQNTMNTDVQERLLAELGLLVSQGKKIQAIKLYRECTGLGLAEAKKMIDQIEQMRRSGGL